MKNDNIYRYLISTCYLKHAEIIYLAVCVIITVDLLLYVVGYPKQEMFNHVTIILSVPTIAYYYICIFIYEQLCGCCIYFS